MFDTLEHLAPMSKILLLGCGGGYDIFCGIPLYLRLKELYKDVYLGNLSFTKNGYLSLFQEFSPGSRIVNHTTTIPEYDYFPEYDLSRQLKTPIYTFTDNGLVAYDANISK